MGQLLSYLATLDKPQASCRTRATHSWRQIKSLETQKYLIFFTFYDLIWFLES